MENNTIERLEKLISNLESKLEMYYQLLLTKNELDFVMRGTYLVDELNQVMNGNY